MNPERIAELRALFEASTTGPWRAYCRDVGARAALPECLDEIERLQREIKRLQREHLEVIARNGKMRALLNGIAANNVIADRHGNVLWPEERMN